jgi:lysozyme
LAVVNAIPTRPADRARTSTIRAVTRLWPGLLLLILLVAAAEAHQGIFFWVRHHHPIGIDVSHHQGRVDWHRARSAGVAFAFIKATEGASLTDPSFDLNWSEAHASGVLRGAYHFFTFCSPGRDQAAHFVAVVPVEDQTLPPVVDLEYEGNCKTRPSPEDLRVQLDDFLRIVEAYDRRKVTFYVTEGTYADYGSLTQGHEVFVREMFTPPRWLGGRRWLFWQFDDDGRVDGIEGPIDLNAFNGSVEDLRTLVHRDVAPAH